MHADRNPFDSLLDAAGAGEAEAPAESYDPGRTFALRVVRGEGPGWDVVSREGRIVVGRSPQANLVIDDDSVSRMHCEVVAEGDGFLLRDLGSRNGTWLGGLRVLEVYLTPEARIRVGEVEVAFNILGTAAQPDLSSEARFGGLIGESAAMRAVFNQLARLAVRDTTVLLEGESGTGKELAAEAIHGASPRRERPFLSLIHI